MGSECSDHCADVLLLSVLEKENLLPGLIHVIILIVPFSDFAGNEQPVIQFFLYIDNPLERSKACL